MSENRGDSGQSGHDTSGSSTERERVCGDIQAQRLVDLFTACKSEISKFLGPESVSCLIFFF